RRGGDRGDRSSATRTGKGETMRALPLLGAALLVGLATCGTAAAQNTTALYQSSYATNATSTNLYQQNYGKTIGNKQSPTPNTSVAFGVLSGLSSKGFFERFQSPRPRESFTPLPSIPNPQTNPNAYIRAVGLRPLH